MEGDFFKKGLSSCDTICDGQYKMLSIPRNCFNAYFISINVLPNNGFFLER